MSYFAGERCASSPAAPSPAMSPPSLASLASPPALPRPHYAPLFSQPPRPSTARTHSLVVHAARLTVSIVRSFPDVWCVYPWDALDIDEHERKAQLCEESDFHEKVCGNPLIISPPTTP